MTPWGLVGFVLVWNKVVLFFVLCFAVVKLGDELLWC